MNGSQAWGRSVRGQPLLVLVALLGGWVGLRALLWQPPFPPLVNVPALLGKRHEQANPPAVARPRAGRAAVHRARPSSERRRSVPGPLERSTADPLAPPRQTTPVADALSGVLSPSAAAAPLSERHVAGQQQLLVAAPSQLPRGIAGYFAGSRAREGAGPALSIGLPPAARSAAAGPSRWSADGWLLLRRDSAGTLAAGEPSYGRSQAGAVLRYRLVAASGHRPAAYARATRALADPRETEVALGLAARPIAGVPVSAAAEVRVHQGPAGRELRLAAFAVTELPPVKLALGLRGEAYVQAGYLGGRFATAFVDGQARIDRKLGTVGRRGEVRFGAGAWGGAQKDTARLDVGPSATITFRLGRTQSRLAVDYRWRVAGHAQPDSGPALTISAGF